MTANSSLRQKLGALVYDLPRYTKSMWLTGWAEGHSGWVFVHNRDEHLLSGPQGRGAQCEWRWTSDLHIAKVYPRLGQKLMRRALRDWPVLLGAGRPEAESPADVSFVIGHRGQGRIPHLLATLRSISAQRGAAVECVVVEQSASPEVRDSLPGWVKYVYAPSPSLDAPYCRSLAFNVGASRASGEVLVLHDNDIIAPAEYASEIIKRYREGYEVINLKRFIFYLSRANTERVFSSGGLELNEAPESVMQNAQGGGSVAVSREAYRAVGGFDESFVGWGGEDNEFWERALTRAVWPYGYLPLVHLWHEPQSGKFEQGRQTAELFESRSAVPACIRIEELRGRNFRPDTSGR